MAKYKSLCFKLFFICATVAILVFSIKTNKQLSKLNKELPKILQTQMQLLTVREELVGLLKVYSVSDENGDLKLIRHGKSYDGGYIVATKAFEESDVLLGYGINSDNSFEDQFSVVYNKPSYGFDCGIEHIDSKSKLFTLVRECIATDSFLYNKSTSNNQATSFEQQLDKLNLKDKKLFIKMDIEGAEYNAFSDIIKNKNNITGIALEIHFYDLENTKRALHLLRQLDKDFVLLHVHGNNSAISSGFTTSKTIGVVPSVIELSYINKLLVKDFRISENQSHPLEIDERNAEHLPEAVFEILN